MCLLCSMVTVGMVAMIFLHFCPVMNHEYHQSYAMFAASGLCFFNSECFGYFMRWIVHTRLEFRLPTACVLAGKMCVLFIIFCQLLLLFCLSFTCTSTDCCFSYNDSDCWPDVRFTVWRSTMDASTRLEFYIVGLRFYYHSRNHSYCCRYEVFSKIINDFCSCCIIGFVLVYFHWFIIRVFQS